MVWNPRTATHLGVLDVGCCRQLSQPAVAFDDAEAIIRVQIGYVPISFFIDTTGVQ